MTERPRIKRIDRIGSTAEIPYTRTIIDAKRERWIMDRFYYLMGRGSWFFENPNEMIGAGLVRGYNYFDLKDTGSRIKCLDEMTKENVRTAKRLEKLAKREEAAGHYETAREYYYRASPFYLSATAGIYDSDNEELIWITEKIRENFDKVIKFSPYPMEWVEIPFEGKSIPGILSLTPNRKKAPTILVVPGMDTNKENCTNHLSNPFVSRGMNSLAIDGPGQGESLVRKIWVDDQNYARAGKAVIDYLIKRPEVDPDKIGIHGISMGTYWGPLIAVHDPRVKALSTQMSNFYSKATLFNEVAPNCRLRFMYITGYLNDEELNMMAPKLTLEGQESRIKCPHIIFHGEFDHLTNVNEVYQYFNNLGSEIKELRIYENQFHGIYRFSDEISSMSADWLRDRLNGLQSKQNRKIVLVNWNKEENPVDEKKIAKGFSDLAAEDS
ncbi:MAG: prolyl oligopeptidase family serine peptidase [Pseudomonadota bacterium]